VERLLEAAGEPVVGGHQHPHLVLIPGEDHQQVGAVGPDLGQQRADDLLRKKVAAATLDQRRRLVDEEAAAEGVGDRLLHRRRGVPDVLPLQLERVQLDEAVALQHAVRPQVPRVELRDRRLAGPRVSRDPQVQRHLQHLGVAAGLDRLGERPHVGEGLLHLRHPHHRRQLGFHLLLQGRVPKLRLVQHAEVLRAQHLLARQQLCRRSRHLRGAAALRRLVLVAHGEPLQLRLDCLLS
jgi:hypothetical protein